MPRLPATRAALLHLLLCGALLGHALCVAPSAAADVQGSRAARALLNTPSWHPRHYRKRPAGAEEPAAAGAQPGASAAAGGAAASAVPTGAPQLRAELSHAHVKLNAALEAASGAVPSWWECSSCMLCTFGPDDAPPPPEVHGRIGSCPVCSGCTHHLEMLNLAVPLSKAKIKVVRMHYGNTGASLFLATDADGTESVLKLHGVATPMVTAGKMAQLLRLYRGKKYLPDELLLARALAPMAAECGLEHINIKEWVSPVRAVIPVTGEKIDEPQAVLAEYARGVSLEMLTLKLSSADLLDALAAVPHAALRDAALFDLLFLQGDRHAENVFLGDDGYLKLIDTRDSALEAELDSVFFASTITFERNRVGNEALYNRSKPGVSHHWPQNTLDYRCHVPGGAIGSNLPPKFRECITTFAAMSPADILLKYFPVIAAADAPAATVKASLKATAAATHLHTQARNILDFGFEGALERTAHKNATGRVPFTSGFPKGQPCCAVVLTESARSVYACTPTGHETLPADFVYEPLDLSNFVARYPHTPMEGMPPMAFTPEQQATIDRHRATASAARREAVEVAAPADSGAPPVGESYEARAVTNRAAWLRRVGREDVVAAGGDVFEAVPASGFDKAYKNPCWRNATSLYCIPYFHIIGVSKCGTTDMFRRLSLHPQVAPTHNKGPHFWDERHTVDWYLKLYEVAVPVIEKDPAHAIVGDASSNTLTYSGVGVRNHRQTADGPTLATVLAALQPDLRLIAILRNPVERLYSAFYYYGHYADRYGATPDGFHTFALAQLDTFSTCAVTLSRHDCAMEGYGKTEQLAKGLYAMFLPDYFAAFKREQLLVLRSEVYGDDVEGGLRAAMKHVGLEEPPVEVWSRMVEGKRNNSRKGNGAKRGGAAGDMRNDTRAMLNAFYRSYNEELARLLGDDGYLAWHQDDAPLPAR